MTILRREPFPPDKHFPLIAGWETETLCRDLGEDVQAAGRIRQRHGTARLALEPPRHGRLQLREKRWEGDATRRSKATRA